MTQSQAVIEAIRQLGGIAPLANIYNVALSIPDCEWSTKTPFASIRRIVRHTKGIYVVRKGLYALESHRRQFEANGIVELTPANESSDTVRQFTHSYFQGILLQVGNLRNLSTFAPQQDKNKQFLPNQTIGELRSRDNIPPFAYPDLVKRSSTVDVIWFNQRGLPHSFFEIEHSTDIQNSLLKFCDLQDFHARMVIVADKRRENEFVQKYHATAFEELYKEQRVAFLSYDDLDKQYEYFVANSERQFIL